MTVHCHFYDKEASAGKNPNSRCTGEAAIFVRVTHSNRLCPLCEPCKKTFVAANSTMTEEVKKTIPGAGAYEEVSIADGAEEFKNQAPRKSA